MKFEISDPGGSPVPVQIDLQQQENERDQSCWKPVESQAKERDSLKALNKSMSFLSRLYETRHGAITHCCVIERLQEVLSLTMWGLGVIPTRNAEDRWIR